MKKWICLLVAAMLGFSLNLYAEKVPVKKDGKEIGYVEYSYSEGRHISKEGWGQEVKVSLYNGTSEYVSVTIFLKGVSDAGSKNETLKPYESKEVSFWTEGKYRGVEVTYVYVK